MTTKNALQFSILHLEGTAHEWWHNGLLSLGHQNVTSYQEFSQKLIKRFDQVQPEWYFKELAHLKQHGTVEEFANEFQKLSVTVPDFSQRRLTYLFVEGLKDPIKNIVNPLEPQTVEEAIQKAKKVESNVSKERFRTYPPKSQNKYEGPKQENKEKKHVTFVKSNGIQGIDVKEKK